jgi:hypothetical protein
MIYIPNCDSCTHARNINCKCDKGEVPYSCKSYEYDKDNDTPDH